MLSRPQWLSKGSLRKAVFFVHLWLGLLIGLYFSVIGVTGSILVYREDLEATQLMPERSHVLPPQPGARLLPLSQIIEKLRVEFPEANEAELAFTNPPVSPDGAYLFRLTRDKKALATTINPYTGAVIGRYASQETWVNWVDELHTDLLFNQTGKLANGYAGLLAGLLLLSGVWLWWPATVRQIKLRLTVKKGAGAPRVIADLHNIMGIYPLLLLFVVTITGSVIVFYQPIQNVVMKFAGPARTPRVPAITPPANAQRLPIETLMSIAEQAAPHAHFVFVMYPTRPAQPFYAYRRSETGILPDTRIYLDPYTGKPVQIGSDFTDPNTKRIMRSASGIHFGRWGSGPVKLLYFVLGFIPLGLFVTGVLMYIRRQTSKRARKQRKAALAGAAS